MNNERRRIMENNELRQQQIEALKTLYDYNKRLIYAIPQLTEELNEDKKPDTEEYQQKIVEGLNWEIQILNRTMDLINEEEEKISKESINSHIKILEQALLSKEDTLIAKAMEQEILPVLEQIDEVISEFLLKVL